MKVLNACPFHLKDDSLRVLWEITPRCNMFCKHCLFFQNNQKGIQTELSTEQVYSIIDNLAQDKNLSAIWLSGGEPLLRQDIVSVCRYISSKGITPSLSSNGVLLTKKIIRELSEAGVSYIHLSIDGATSRTHDALRGVTGSFDKLLEKMDLLQDSPIKCGASFMVTEESVGEMEDVVRIANEKGLSVLSFYLVAELGRGADNFGQDKSKLIHQLQDTIARIEVKQKQQGSQLKIEVFRADSYEKGEEVSLQECKADRFLNITYDGKLGACPWLMKSEHGFVVGSLLEEDFLELEKKCRIQTKQKIKERKQNLSSCKTCGKQEVCGKGCLALQINSTGVNQGLDPVCPVGLKVEDRNEFVLL